MELTDQVGVRCSRGVIAEVIGVFGPDNLSNKNYVRQGIIQRNPRR